MIFFKLLIVTGFFFTVGAVAGPCQDKNTAKTDARKSLHQCIEKWTKTLSSNEADPEDDCALALRTYIQSARDLKSCLPASPNGKK